MFEKRIKKAIRTIPNFPKKGIMFRDITTLLSDKKVFNEVVDYNGIKIIGYANVPGRVAKDASSLYAKNIVNFLSLMINKENKKINIDWEDEIIKSVVLTHNGQIKLDRFI